MDDKPRYRLRANGPALSRFQWWIVGVATLVGALGLIFVLTGRPPLGILFLGLSAVANSLTSLSATRRSRST
jgi:hypothetical protein